MVEIKGTAWCPVPGGGGGGTMKQVCFTAISSNRACHHGLHCSQINVPAHAVVVRLSECSMAGVRGKDPSSLLHCTRSAVACWAVAVGVQTFGQAHALAPGQPACWVIALRSKGRTCRSGVISGQSRGGGGGLGCYDSKPSPRCADYFGFTYVGGVFFLPLKSCHNGHPNPFPNNPTLPPTHLLQGTRALPGWGGEQSKPIPERQRWAGLWKRLCGGVLGTGMACFVPLPPQGLA